MIHKACMPVYMNSGKIVAGRVDGNSKVLQEVLADLKRLNSWQCLDLKLSVKPRSGRDGFLRLF